MSDRPSVEASGETAAPVSKTRRARRGGEAPLGSESARPQEEAASAPKAAAGRKGGQQVESPSDGPAPAAPSARAATRRAVAGKAVSAPTLEEAPASSYTGEGPAEPPSRRRRSRATQAAPATEIPQKTPREVPAADSGETPPAEPRATRRRGRPAKKAAEVPADEGVALPEADGGLDGTLRPAASRPSVAPVPADLADAMAPGDERAAAPTGLRRRHYERHEPVRQKPQGNVEAAATKQPAQREVPAGNGRYQRDRANGFSSQKQRGPVAGQQAGGSKRQNKDRRASREAMQPQTSRDGLVGLPCADLRLKAVETGVDPVGLKKADLVEIVYRELVKREGFFEFKGILDIGSDGTGYVRTKSYLPSEGDVYVSAGAIRANGLRRGDEVEGIAHSGRSSDKYAGLNRVVSVNGRPAEDLGSRPRFGDLTPVFPTEPLRMEHGRDSILGRCIDLVAPIGKGQRGLIVSPPKAGKTTVLKKIAESIAANNPEVHLICLLVDERPEEVTDMQRSIKGEVVASTFDMPSDNHITVSELVIERAKRLVELGEDVVILLDSITRLARAYNLAQPASGRILSGGVDSTALYPPKRFLGAARNIENGGSLTILASALVDTGSKMDEVIFEEFKGTGNMELKLDRDLADRRIFPAIDPVTSGTRKEELLLDSGLAPFVWGIRRVLAGMNSNERAMSSLIKSLKATENNEEFLIRSAKKAQLQEPGGEL